MIVAVCDDESYCRDAVMQNLIDSGLMPEDTEYHRYSSATNLLTAYADGQRFDIVFLDVEMSGTDGILAGVKIREYDDKVIIIFVSAYDRYAIPAYDCEPFRFITKPIDKTLFNKAIKKALLKYASQRGQFVIKNNNASTKISTDDILYIESYKKHLIIHTADKQYETPGRLGEAEAKLRDYGFCRVHQGYIVNMEHIDSFDSYDIVLSTGEKVMMSIRRKAEVLKKYAQYLERMY